MSIVHRMLSRETPPAKPGTPPLEKRNKNEPSPVSAPSKPSPQSLTKEQREIRPKEATVDFDAQLDAVEKMLDAQEREHEKIKKLMTQLDEKLKSVATVVAGEKPTKASPA